MFSGSGMRVNVLAFLLNVLSVFILPVVSLFTSVVFMLKSDHLRIKMLYGLLFSVSIGLIFVHFYPVGDLDMARYYYFMNYLKGLEYAGVLEVFLRTGDALSYGMMYAVATTMGNHFIPLLASIFVYMPLIFVILNIGRRGGFSGKRVNLALFVLLITTQLVMTVGGVRFGMAASMFVLALYVALAAKKRWAALLLCGVSIMMHSSMAIVFLVALAVRGVLTFRLKNRYYWILIISLPLAFLLTPLLVRELGVPLTDFNAARKLVSYIGSPLLSTTYYFWFNFAVSIVSLAILLPIRRSMKSELGFYVVSFNVAVLVFGLVTVAYPIVSGRFMVLAKCLTLISLFCFFGSGQLAGYGGRVAYRTLLLLFAILLAGSAFYQIYSFGSIYIDWSRLYPFTFELDYFRVLTLERSWI